MAWRCCSSRRTTSTRRASRCVAAFRWSFPSSAPWGRCRCTAFSRPRCGRSSRRSKDPNGAAYVLLRTSDTEVTRGLWPHPFRATLRVTLDEALSTSLTIENTGNAPFEFQSGLHTYLRVGDVRRVTIAGSRARDVPGLAPEGRRTPRGLRPPAHHRADQPRLPPPSRPHHAVRRVSRPHPAHRPRRLRRRRRLEPRREGGAHASASPRAKSTHHARRRTGAGRAEDTARAGPALERHPASPARRDLSLARGPSIPADCGDYARKSSRAGVNASISVPASRATTPCTLSAVT